MQKIKLMKIKLRKTESKLKKKAKEIDENTRNKEID